MRGPQPPPKANENHSAREGQSAAFWAGSVARAYRVASLSGDLFWTLTPSEVDEIMREAVGEWRDKARAASYNAALICASLYNCHLRPKEPYAPEDFLPSIKPPKPEIPPDVVASKANMAMGALATLNQ